MPIRFQSDPPRRSERLLHLTVAALHLILVVMILYLRFGPFSRVLERMGERGAQVPAWFPVTFTVGAVALAVFLAVRGLLSFRRYRLAASAPPENG